MIHISWAWLYDVVYVVIYAALILSNCSEVDYRFDWWRVDANQSGRTYSSSNNGYNYSFVLTVLVETILLC